MPATARNLKSLATFCQNRGIEISEHKTQVVNFGKEAMSENSLNLPLNEKPLAIAESCCYLGISFRQSGGVILAQHSLETKAMRPFLGLNESF